jgi:hypothetical protein
MINLGFQESTYITVTKTIPVIDITQSAFMPISFVTTIYYTYQMAGKGSNSEVLKIVQGTQYIWHRTNQILCGRTL